MTARPPTPDDGRERLIAPCGMDCGVCSAYLAYASGVPRRRGAITHRRGCRARKKRCAYLKGQCARLANGTIDYCFQCGGYPCVRLRRLDARYARDYGMSLLANLEIVRVSGVRSLIDRQEARFGCAACGALRSVHNQRCFACESVTHWRS